MARRNYGDESGEMSTPVVLRREVPWETYLTARLLSDGDLQLIRRYDKATNQTKPQLLKEAGPDYVRAFMAVLRNVTKEDVVQYVLAVLDDMLTEDSSKAKLFHQPNSEGSGDRPEYYGIFLRLLQRTDWFTQEKSCRLLTSILESRPREHDGVASNGASSSRQEAARPIDEVLNSFVNWLCAQLRRPANTSRSVLVAVSALSHVLKERPVRSLLLKSGGIPLLGPLLKTSSGNASPSLQLLYETALCVWQLTFLQEAAEEVASSRDIISSLVELARTAQKEKVVRVALNALKNLLLNSSVDTGPVMVEAGLQKVVAQRKLQNWEDEDVPAVLDLLGEKLAENIQLLSSYEKYKREILSENLDWSPMHTSTEFWRENVGKLEEKDFQILRVLLKLLEKARDPKVLSVGCSDVGFFISYHPTGRQVVQDLRGKELVMRLMMHPDANVQKQALLCVQKIMLTQSKLEFLNNQNEA